MNHSDIDMQTTFRIGDWKVEPASCRLSCGEKEVKLEPKVMTVLVYLARSPNKVISRDEMESEAWSGMVVSYDALTNTIIKLRKAFNDNPRSPSYIETVPKKGYRLIAEVSVNTGETTATENETHSKTATFSTKYFNAYSMAGGFIAILVLVVLAGISNNPSSEQMAESKPFKSEKKEKKSIVVLPFKNLNNDPRYEYFSDGITEDLITDLSKYPDLLVIARSSAFTYKNSDKDERQIAKELNVNYLLEGSIRRDSSRLLINVQLVDASSGTNLWAERYEEKVENLFSIQSKVRNNIADSLQVKLSEQDKKSIIFQYTSSTEAYDLFLRANSLYKKHAKQDNKAARALVEQAIGIDNDFARAYSLLSLTRIDEYRYDWTDNPENSVQSAIQFAEKATDIDPHLPQAYWILGYVHLWGTQQYAFAEKMAKKSIAIEPSFADAYALLSLIYLTMGQFEKAIEYVDTAMRLNPHYPAEYPSVKGYAYYWLGDYQQAQQQLNEALERNLNRIRPNIFLTAVFYRLGLQDEMQWQAENVIQLDPDFSVNDWALRQAYSNPAMKEQIVADLHAAGLKN